MMRELRGRDEEDEAGEGKTMEVDILQLEAQEVLAKLAKRVLTGYYMGQNAHMGFNTKWSADGSPVRQWSLSRLIYQPRWRGGNSLSRESDGCMEETVRGLDGHLFYGNYGDHYGDHKYETVQLILCKSRDIQSLVMLSDREKERLSDLMQEDHPGCVEGEGPILPAREWLLGLKVTGDGHVCMGAISCAVPLTGHNGGSLMCGLEGLDPDLVPESLTGRGKHKGGMFKQEDASHIVAAYSGFGTLAYPGYLSPSWCEGAFMLLSSGKWCMSFGANQDPILFSQLTIGEGMSFVEPTELRDHAPSAAVEAAPTAAGLRARYAE